MKQDIFVDDKYLKGRYLNTKMLAALLDLLRKFLGLTENINKKKIACLITKIIFQSILSRLISRNNKI